MKGSLTMTQSLGGITNGTAALSMSNTSHGGNTYPSSTSGGGSTGGVGLSTNTYTSRAPTNTYTSRAPTSVASGTGSTQRSTPSIAAAPGFNPHKFSSKAPSSVAGSTTTNNTTAKKGNWSKPKAGPKAKKQVSASEDEDSEDVLSSESD
jgi:hypothetical protein